MLKGGGKWQAPVAQRCTADQMGPSQRRRHTHIIIMDTKFNIYIHLVVLVLAGVCYVPCWGTTLYDVNQAHSSDEILSRSRRAIGGTGITLADTNSLVYMAAPPVTVATVTFALEAFGPYSVAPSLGVGQKVQFVLFVHIPPGTTDLLVELFTPDSTTTFMKLCHVEVLDTGALTFDVPTPVLAVLDAKDGSTNYDRAVLNFGNVTTTATAVADDTIIRIVWEAVMLDPATTGMTNGGTYHCSAGAEYNNEAEIWVGQHPFTADTNAWNSANPPDFTLAGPANFEIGTSQTFTIDMYLSEAVTSVAVDVFSPLNDPDIISICSLTVTFTGEGYSCYEELWDLPFTVEPSTSGETNDYGRIELGDLINAMARQEEALGGAVRATHIITVSFIAFLKEDTTIIGTAYDIGAAVEVGTTQIWAGTFTTTAIAQPVYPAMVTLPTISIGPPNGTVGPHTVMVGQAALLEITMDVPPNEPSLYQLALTMPIPNNDPRFRVCKVYMKSAGRNVPCLSNTEPVYSASPTSLRPEINDLADWDIGYINNPQHVTTLQDPDGGKIVFAVAIAALNMSANTDGAVANISAGIMYVVNSQIWVGATDVTISTASPFTGAIVYPTATMAYDVFGDVLYVTEARKVDMTIQFTAGEIYRPMTVEILTPADDTARVSICKVEITYVGTGLGCYDHVTQNKSFVYHSRSNDDKYDRAVLQMDPIESLAEATDPANDSALVISVYAKLEPHPLNVQADVLWIGGGIIFEDNRIWVGSLDVNLETIVYPTLNIPAFVHISRYNDTTTDVGIGMPVMYDVLIKIEGKEAFIWSVEAEVTGDLSLCYIRVMEYGTNYPCGDMDIEDVLVPEPDGFTFLTGRLDGGVATNIGDGPYVANDVFDENTIRVQVAAQMDKTSVLATLSTLDIKVNTFEVGADVMINETMVNLNTIATPPLVADNYTWPEIDLYVGELHENMSLRSDNEIARGESILMRLDLTFDNFTSVNKMEVKFLTPVNESGLLQICDVNVVHVGSNLPCINKKTFLDTEIIVARVNSEYMDIGSMDLGFVCHWPFDDPLEVPGASTLTVEAVVRLTRNNTLVENDEVLLSTTVKLNDQQIYVEQYPLIVREEWDGVTDNVTVQGVDMDYNGTLSGLSWKPGIVYNLAFVATIPAYVAARVTVDVQLPYYNSSVSTLWSVDFTTNGRNLGCLVMNNDKEFLPSYYSALNTSQNDRMILDLGIVMNTAQTFRNGKENETTEDNQFGIVIEMQMADAVQCEFGSTHELSVGLSAAEIVVVIVSVDITVDRDADAQPHLVLDVEANQTLMYSFGENIPITGRLQHDSTTSRAESINLVMAYYYPPVLQFIESSWSTNCTHTDITFADASSVAGKLIWWDALYFTDICDFTFNLKVTPDPLEDQPVQQQATTPFEICGYMRVRPEVTNSDRLICEPMQFMQFDATIQSIDSCDQGWLGMDDTGVITDCQITGSSSPDLAMQPHNGRCGTTGAWKTGVRSSAFATYMQVDFGKVVKVYIVRLEYPGAGDRVTSILLQYSNDGIAFTDGDTLPVTPSYTTTDVSVLNPIKSRYIRVNIASQASGGTEAVQLRADFKGCVYNGTEVASPCPTISDVPELRSRCFIATASHIYACDIDRADETSSKCFSSADGSLWITLDFNVMSIIGWETGLDVVFGVARDRRTYMMTDDAGVTWNSISGTYMQQQQNLDTYVAAMEVPWLPESELSPDSEPTADYTMGNWGAAYAGIYQNPGSWIKVVDWTTCCL